MFSALHKKLMRWGFSKENCSSQMDVPLSFSRTILCLQLGSPAVSRLAPGSGKCHGKNDNKQAQPDNRKQNRASDRELLISVTGIVEVSDYLQSTDPPAVT